MKRISHTEYKDVSHRLVSNEKSYTVVEYGHVTYMRTIFDDIENDDDVDIDEYYGWMLQRESNNCYFISEELEEELEYNYQQLIRIRKLERIIDEEIS